MFDVFIRDVISTSFRLELLRLSGLSAAHRGRRTTRSMFAIRTYDFSKRINQIRYLFYIFSRSSSAAGEFSHFVLLSSFFMKLMTGSNPI